MFFAQIKMNEYHFVVKQGENNFVLPYYLSLKESSKVKISNLIVTWRFQNLTRDETVTVTADDGTISNVLFQPGWWSFSAIRERLAEEDVTLTKIVHNNSCRIFSQDKALDLGLIGELLGFGPGKKIAKNTFVDSRTVNINLGVRTVSIGCSLVNSTKRFDRAQKSTQVVATIPLPTNMSPNFGVQKWSAQTTRGEFQSLTFNVNDNTGRGLMSLYAEFDCSFC